MKSFIKAYEPLKVYLKIYETSDVGKQVYLESLEATNKYFPQYLVELKGMADGADISFHEVRISLYTVYTQQSQIIQFKQINK